MEGMFSDLAPARFAVVGSRDWKWSYYVDEIVNGLPAGSVVVSGAARGVDRWAEDAAIRRGLEVDIYPADWSMGRGAGYARNAVIVKESDVVIAFWDGKSSGTADTIGRARAAGKPVYVCKEPGKWEALLIQ